MQIQIITLKFNTALEQFDETPFNEFIKGKTILSVREHFFIRETIPFITLFIQYKTADNELHTDQNAEKSSRKSDESWRKIISEDEIPLFNRLRDWRTQRAGKDGKPVYIIFNNTEFAHIVKAMPKTLADLIKIKGIGTAKTEMYGKDILNILWPEKKEEPKKVIVKKNKPDDLSKSDNEKDTLFKSNNKNDKKDEIQPK